MTDTLALLTSALADRYAKELLAWLDEYPGPVER